jgi:hypothetical protein
LYVDEKQQPVDDSPVMALLEVEWMEAVKDEDGVQVTAYSGRSPVLRKNPDSDWNIHYRYEEALKVEPYNVIFRKRDYYDPLCEEYVGLSRNPARLFNRKRT